MGSANSVPEEEQARKLERVFHIFACAQEDWAMTHNPGKSTGDMEKDARVPAYGAKRSQGRAT